MNYDDRIHHLAVCFSLTNSKAYLHELLNVLSLEIQAKARTYSKLIPAYGRELFEAKLREGVYLACKDGVLGDLNKDVDVRARINCQWLRVLHRAKMEAHRMKNPLTERQYLIS